MIKLKLAIIELSTVSPDKSRQYRSCILYLIVSSIPSYSLVTEINSGSFNLELYSTVTSLRVKLWGNYKMRFMVTILLHM